MSQQFNPGKLAGESRPAAVDPFAAEGPAEIRRSGGRAFDFRPRRLIRGPGLHFMYYDLNLDPGIDKALNGLPPNLSAEAKQSLQEFLKFSLDNPKSEGTQPWGHGEQLAYLAGFLAGRGSKIVQSN